MRKTQIQTINPVYLGLSLLDLSKTVMYEFCYNYVKSKDDENGKRCYMDTNSFIVRAETEGLYKDVVEDISTRVDSSNFQLDRSFSNRKHEKVIGSMKYELGQQTIKEFVGLRALNIYR